MRQTAARADHCPRDDVIRAVNTNAVQHQSLYREEPISKNNIEMRIPLACNVVTLKKGTHFTNGLGARMSGVPP
jgi:hypothetical protein